MLNPADIPVEALYKLDTFAVAAISERTNQQCISYMAMLYSSRTPPEDSIGHLSPTPVFDWRWTERVIIENADRAKIPLMIIVLHHDALA